MNTAGLERAQAMSEMMAMEAPDVVVFQDGWVTARISHQCTGCYREIEKGDRYLKQVVVQDGRLIVNKECGNC